MRPVLNRVMNMLIHPETEWQAIKDEPVTYGSLLLNYVAPLAAIPPLAVIASGGFILNSSLPNSALVFPLVHLLMTNLLWYFMYVLNVVVVGAVITVIVMAPGDRWTGLQGFKVAAYSFTPLFIAGFIATLPKMDWVIYAAILYSIYLLYLGIASIAGTSKKQSVGYAAVSFLASVVLVGLMNAGEYFLESFVVNKFVL
jgi:hypothetical protein